MAVYTYNTLEAFQLSPEVPITRYPSCETRHVSNDQPATSVMTDLRYVSMITVRPDETIDFAMQLMIHAGVRLLIVMDSNDSLLGLISGRDILGEKPVSLISMGKMKREEIRVMDIMTPRSLLNPLNLSDVEHATVRDIIDLLHKTSRQHAIVVEKDEQREGEIYYLRGIFSITQIGRQIGVEISPDDHAQSFVELEQAIAKNISALN